MTATVDAYCRQVLAACEPMTRQQEEDAFARLRAGDDKAREQILTANLRFVMDIACEYEGRGLDLEDLIGEGNVGLATAVDRFDETRGFKFITYAVWWIRQAIKLALAEQTTVRRPTNARADYRKVAEAEVSLAQRLGRTPTWEEVEDASGLPPGRRVCARLAASTETSMEAGTEECRGPGRVYHDRSLHDRLGHEDGADLDEGTVAAAVAAIPDARIRAILTLHYGLDAPTGPLTLEAIGEIYGVTRERIRQLRQDGLAILRKRAGRQMRELARA